MNFLIPAAALILTLAAAEAVACSPVPNPPSRSNLDLVEEAETIVLARVIGGHEDERGRHTALVIRPLATVKGEPPGGDIAIAGIGLPYEHNRPGNERELSNPYEFDKPHPASWMGSCIRAIFPLGTTALFFLRTDHEGMWAPAATPFSRWAEDVPDSDAPWVQLVRLYTIAAGLPEADRAPFLADEREALLARTDEPVARLMADDIGRQLEAPAERRQDRAGIDFRDPADESTVDAALKAMRQGAVEAGN